MRNDASLCDFGLTSLFTLFFYNQIINTIFIKTFLIFYLIIYVYYTIFYIVFILNRLIMKPSMCNRLIAETKPFKSFIEWYC